MNSINLPVCRLCNSDKLVTFQAKEMMLGLRDSFEYRECNGCGCVQVAQYPDDMSRYYPNDYYSYEPSVTSDSGYNSSLFNRIKRSAKTAVVNRSATSRQRFLNSIPTRNWLSSRPVVQLYLEHVPDPKAAILDIGCGSGGLLKSLHYIYYENLHGVDPYAASDVWLDGQLLVRKALLNDLNGTYDFISMNHVFEHMAAPADVLKEVRRKLNPNGKVMIRIPLVGGAAWRTYRENWVQLDAPRHFYLHSETSFRRLAADAGFLVDLITYDSNDLQFWGSELYLRDIPLMDERSPAKSRTSVFSDVELSEFGARAKVLNGLGNGDQIMAILRVAAE